MAAGGGRLVLVATPIGNLGDLSPRAAAAIGGADVLCCEDTRHTRKLLSHAGLRPGRVVAVHEHNEVQQSTAVARWVVEEGLTVVVVTDAGLPGISDPGERLVAAVAAAGGVVEVVPGPSAALGALVVSGLPTGRFSFEGFLPRKGGERADRIAVIARDERTTVLYEAPTRVGQTLRDLAGACGPDRRVAVVRELTKLHEETWRGTLAEGAARAAAAEPRGEHVLVLEGAPPVAPAQDAEVTAALAAALAGGTSVRDASAEVASALGVPKRRAYELAVVLRAEANPAGGATPAG